MPTTYHADITWRLGRPISRFIAVRLEGCSVMHRNDLRGANPA